MALLINRTKDKRITKSEKNDVKPSCFGYLLSCVLNGVFGEMAYAVWLSYPSDIIKAFLVRFLLFIFCFGVYFICILTLHVHSHTDIHDNITLLTLLGGFYSYLPLLGIFFLYKCYQQTRAIILDVTEHNIASLTLSTDIERIFVNLNDLQKTLEREIKDSKESESDLYTPISECFIFLNQLESIETKFYKLRQLSLKLIQSYSFSDFLDHNINRIGDVILTFQIIKPSVIPLTKFFSYDHSITILNNPSKEADFFEKYIQFAKTFIYEFKKQKKFIRKTIKEINDYHNENAAIQFTREVISLGKIKS